MPLKDLGLEIENLNIDIFTSGIDGAESAEEIKSITLKLSGFRDWDNSLTDKIYLSIKDTIEKEMMLIEDLLKSSIKKLCVGMFSSELERKKQQAIEMENELSDFKQWADK